MNPFKVAGMCTVRFLSCNEKCQNAFRLAPRQDAKSAAIRDLLKNTGHNCAKDISIAHGRARDIKAEEYFLFNYQKISGVAKSHLLLNIIYTLRK